jgi:hypothetical protein
MSNDMTRLKLFLGILLGFSLLMVQVGGALAAGDHSSATPVRGVVQSITLETDPTTGVTIVVLDILDDDLLSQRIQVSLETAITLGFVVRNGDGKPGINTVALGKPVEIDPAQVIEVQKEDQHPVGSALATFFSGIPGLEYETIMSAYEQGVGFGAIAQTLWMTTKLEGDVEVFEALLMARQTGDYSAFVLKDGSTPQNWGQLRKAVLENGRNGLGVVVSNRDNPGNGNGNNNRDNNRGNNGNGNQGNRDQEKEKNKNK